MKLETELNIYQVITMKEHRCINW